ncbi:MAG: aminodeoxychorismate synthase component I [Myxococcota bacterium]
MTHPPIVTALARRDLETDRDAPACWRRLADDPCPWWLDSAGGDRRLARYSFMGSDPYLVMRSRGGRVDLECRRPVHPGLEPGHSALEHDPLDVLRSLLPRLAEGSDGDAEDWPFVGGAVGYLGYELGEWTQPVRLHARDDRGLPDCAWLFGDYLLAFDHATGRSCALGLGFGADAEEARRRAGAAADRTATRFRDLPAAAAGKDLPQRRARLVDDQWPAQLQAQLDRAAHAKAVQEILEAVAAGNVYQANLTHCFEAPFRGDVRALYDDLRSLSPAPFAAFLGLPEVSVLSSSPERFLELDRRGRAECRPIKGTRARGATAEEDERLRAALAGSAKDRAENLMIVDLVRNDLGRVCDPGSVEVPELMAIESYASVFQMVSTVRGRLRGDRDAVDLVRATFPPGSMTGAPKIAAMRIIDRLEPVRRGIYSGAIGYLDARGGLDLSVAIRTLTVAGGRAHVHVGGGIVADSDPDLEWRETLDKARPMLAALARAAGA